MSDEGGTVRGSGKMEGGNQGKKKEEIYKKKDGKKKIGRKE